METLASEVMRLSGKDIFKKINDNIEMVMRGQSVAIRKLLSAFVSGGHVLLEDYPGTGKTTMAKALALSIDAKFKRIQFTPDLLPSDIWVSPFSTSRIQASIFMKDRYLPILCWQMRSTGPPPEPNPRCWKLWRNPRSASMVI